MQHLNPKVLIVFFTKNRLGTIYILPIWWIGVSIFGRVWTPRHGYLPKEQILLLLDGSGIIFLIVLIIGSYYWAWLTYSNYSYALQNDGLHIYRGVIIKRHTIILYNHIQTIEVYINPFVTRLLGIYNLHIKTSKIENTARIVHHASVEQLPGFTHEVLHDLRGQLIASSHILAVKPRKYFDPATGIFH